MAITVNPGEKAGRIPVVTIVLPNNQHLPVYSQSDAEGNAIDEGNPLPIIIPTSSLKNYGSELALGNIPGRLVGTVFGHNTDLDPAGSAMVWDYGKHQPIEVLLPADTELFLSSSYAGDIGTIVIIIGKTDDYAVKTLIHTFTTGQSQQSIGNWFRVEKITVIGGSALSGDLYCTEVDTLTAGVPDTPTGVHAMMHAGTGTTHKASGTVPAGHTMLVNRLFLGTRRGEDCVFDFMVKSGNMPDFIEASGFPVYQGTIFEQFDPPFPVAEKTDFYFRGTTVTNNTQVYANFGFELVDHSGEVVPGEVDPSLEFTTEFTTEFVA